MLSGPSLDKWLSQFNKNAKIVLKVSRELLAGAAKEFYKRVVEKTPVGDPVLWKYPAHKNYVPGSLKAAWELDIKEESATISNKLPYAQRVEYGWSTQAPNGMMRLTVLEFPDIIKSVKIGR